MYSSQAVELCSPSLSANIEYILDRSSVIRYDKCISRVLVEESRIMFNMTHISCGLLHSVKLTELPLTLRIFRVVDCLLKQCQ